MTATETKEAIGTENGVAEFDFSHLEIADAVAKFDMPWVGRPGAYLMVRVATSENEKYTAGSLRMGGKRQRKLVEGVTLTRADNDEDRAEDKILYGKYIVVGWDGVTTKQGDLVPFSPANCKAFIAILPNWIFDRLRIFCMKPEKFLSEGDLNEATEPDAVEVAGN